ncbi:hypothetical protein MTR_1g089300 [Medicago truncatula]|uniref:Uncharacterized protein n=1 Tax=Medicago truncatula TaxID=3880 RepID=G7I2T5_MEDTR|nr:hypothetical protein MTR_1g089300 [Medicago truncatula]
MWDMDFSQYTPVTSSTLWALVRESAVTPSNTLLGLVRESVELGVIKQAQSTKPARLTCYFLWIKLEFELAASS